MPRPRRIYYPGAFFHIYNRGVAKSAIVSDDYDRRMFMHLLGQAVTENNLRLYAYCLLDNHFHLFVQQTSEISISHALWQLGTQYVSFYNKKMARCGPLFQNRFRSRLVDADEYATHLIRYIHLNPVEARITNHPAEFQWSSYPSYVGLLPQWDWLGVSWGLRFFGDHENSALRKFQHFHTQTLPEDEKRILSETRRHLTKANLLGAGPLKGPGT